MVYGLTESADCCIGILADMQSLAIAQLMIWMIMGGGKRAMTPLRIYRAPQGSKHYNSSCVKLLKYINVLVLLLAGCDFERHLEPNTSSMASFLTLVV